MMGIVGQAECFWLANNCKPLIYKQYATSSVCFLRTSKLVSYVHDSDWRITVSHWLANKYRSTGFEAGQLGRPVSKPAS